MRSTSLSLGLVLAGACFLSGCAEPFTFSHDFKQEGLRQYNRGEFVDATGSFKAAAKQDPTDYQTQYYLGVTSEKTGEYQTAVEAYRLCLKLRIQMPAGRQDLAMRDKVLSRLAGLIAHNDSADSEINAIEQDAQSQKSAEDYRLLARIQALRGDADSAVNNYRKACSYAEEDAGLTREYAFYLLKIKQTPEGTRILKKAWDLDPTDHQVARTLQELGVTDSDLVVSSTRMENEQPAPAPANAWDAVTSARD